MPVIGQLIGLLGATSLGTLTIGGGLLGSVAFRLAASVALSALSTALAPKPRAPGIRTDQTLAGGTIPESFVLGQYATGGYFAAPPPSHGQVGKTPNAYLNYIVELSGIPGQTLDGLILDGEAVEILEADPHPDYGKRIGGRFEGAAWVKYYDGTQTAADPMLVAKYPVPYIRPWTADMVGAGLCYAIITAKRDNEIFKGLLSLRYVLGPAPMLDPREVSPVAGSNAAQQIYNILRGVTLPSGDVWGGGIPAADLPATVWETALDAADALVDDGDGGTEPAFRAGMEVRVDDEPFSVLERFLVAADATLTETGGVWKLRVGGPGLPVATITDDDIIADEPEDYTPFPPPDQTYNAITGTYPDPAALWEPTESELLTNADWEAEDGGRRLTASVDLSAAPYPVQVQRVNSALIASHRRMARHILTLPARHLRLEAGDVLAWNSDYNGYTAKLFEVAECVRDLRTQKARVSLREVDPTDHEVPVGLQLPTPVTPGPLVPAPQAVVGFAVTPTTINDGTNPRRPALAATWTADAADDARGVRLRIRVDGDTGDGDQLALYPVTDGGAWLVEGILPAVTYQVRARYAVDRATIWTDWITVTAPDVRISDDDLDAEIIGRIDTLRDWIDGGVTDLPGDLGTLAQDIVDETNARVQAVADEAAARLAQNTVDADRWRSARDDLRRLAAEVLDLAAHDAEAREAIRQSLTVTINDLSASVTADLLVVIDDQSATAAQVLQLEAANTALESALTQAEVARVAGDDALAALISALAVGTAVQFDQAVIWYFDATVEDWGGSPSPPTVAGGYLKPAAAGYVTSPTGLAVASATYRQVRARLRRVGTPTWTGYVWWAASGQGWDAGRRVTADEPVWESDIGLMTVDADWTGTIDAIRFDPADGADGSNYIEIDWIAVGRPAPGASSAELDAERSARIAADSAQASDIVALDARLTTAEGTGSANATAIDALDVRVEDTEDGLVSLGTRTTALETTVNDAETGVAATAAALDQLETLVQQTDDEILLLLAQATRALQTSLRRVAAEGIEQGARHASESQQVRDYLATASQTLTTRIDATDDEVTVIAEAVTLLQAEIPGLATATALAALTAVVTDLDGALAAEVSARQLLAADVADNAAAILTEASARATADAAEATARQALAVDVADNAAAILTEQQARVDGDAAEASARQALAVDVADNTAAISTEASTRASADAAEAAARQALAVDVADNAAAILTEQQARVDGDAAEASARQALAVTVGNNTAAISTEQIVRADADNALADAIMQVAAGDGTTLGTARMRFTVETGPTGYSRVGMQARVDQNDTFRAAGFYIDVPNNTALPTLYAIEADQFVIMDGTTGLIPFSVSGGVVRANELEVDFAKVTNFEVVWADIETIIANNLTVNNAQITGNIESDNYAEDGGGIPTAGFRLDRTTGAIKARTITGSEVITRDLLVTGSTFTQLAPTPILGNFPRADYAGDNVWTLVQEQYFGPSDAGDTWQVSASGELRRWARTSENPAPPPQFLTYTEVGAIKATRSVRKVSGGPWSAEEDLTSREITNVNDDNWNLYNFSERFSGIFHQVVYRLYVKRDIVDGGYVFAPGEKEAEFNHRDLQLIITWER